MIGLRALAPFATRAPVAARAACELCGAGLGDPHRHVVEVGARGALCACVPCAVLFTRGDSSARFRTVPERVIADPGFALAPAAFAQLGVPVGLAAVWRSRGRWLAGYPGPAGLTEAELEPAAWQAIAGATALAGELADDVEALLIHGDRGATALTCHLVPITTVYELAGQLRASWRGFAGGDEALGALRGFLAELDRRARRVARGAGSRRGDGGGARP